MRWITVVAGLALLMAVTLGCAKQCFLSECDYQHYREVAGLHLPDDLESNHETTSQPGLANFVPKPATVLDPERKIRYMSLAEAIAIALEQGTTSVATGGNLDPLPIFGETDRGGTFSDNTQTIQVLALDPARTGTNIDEALSKFDARFIASANWTYTDQPSGNPATAIQQIGQSGRNLLPGVTTARDTVTASMLKPLPTGGVAGITFSTQYTNTNSPIQRINPSYAPTLQFQFEQPLLQNFGIEINQLLPSHPGSVLTPFQTGLPTDGILITRIHYDQSRAEFERNVQLMVTNVEQAYWSLYGAYWDLFAQESALRQAYEAWRINTARYQAGRVGIDELSQTRGQYELFRGNRLQSLGRVLEAERALRGFLRLPIEDGCRLVPSDQPTLAPYQPDWETALHETLTLKPELVIAREDLKIVQLFLLRAKNQLLPDLRFTSTYELNSLGNRLDGPDAGNAFRELASNHFDNWTLALQLNMPLGFREAHAEIRLARLNLAKRYLTVRDAEYRAVRNLELQYRQIFEQYAFIETLRSQREAYAIQLRARFEQFLAGRGTLDILLEAQRFWATALSQEYAAIVAYNNALVNFELAKGTVLHHDNIVIAEGKLPHCAQLRAVEHERERTAALVLLEHAQPVPYKPACDKGGPVLPELPLNAAPSLPSLFKDAPTMKDVPEHLPSPRPLSPMPPQAPGTENKGTPSADGKTSSSLQESLPPLAIPQTTPPSVGMLQAPPTKLP
jgi:outer membrane protein TolC